MNDGIRKFVEYQLHLKIAMNKHHTFFGCKKFEKNRSDLEIYLQQTKRKENMYNGHHVK